MMQQRLLRELKAFQAGSTASEGLALTVDPDLNGSNHDITKLTGVIFGPKDTPYHGGVFRFSVRIPGDYPTQPPKVKILTTDSGKCRFNPNFYSNGKVCVSVLNTFGNEDWTAALNLVTVFRSIQSMMTEDPYHNEPGFETCGKDADCAAYAAKITHEVLRHAVCDQFEGKLIPLAWRDIAVSRFLENVDVHVSVCNKLAPVWDGKPFVVARFEGPDNQAVGAFGFAVLKSRLIALKQSLSQGVGGAADVQTPPVALAPQVEVPVPSAVASALSQSTGQPASPATGADETATTGVFRGAPNANVDDAMQAVLVEVASGERSGCEQLLAAIAFCLMEDPVVEPLAGLTPACQHLAAVLGYVEAGDGTLILNPSKANRENFEVVQAVLADALE